MVTFSIKFIPHRRDLKPIELIWPQHEQTVAESNTIFDNEGITNLTRGE